MKPSNRKKLSILRHRRDQNLAWGRYRRYSCSCGHHSMREQSEWATFIATAEGRQWALENLTAWEEL